MSMDVDSHLIIEWLVTGRNIHDSKVSHETIDSVRDFSSILADSANYLASLPFLMERDKLTLFDDYPTVYWMSSF